MSRLSKPRLNIRKERPLPLGEAGLRLFGVVKAPEPRLLDERDLGNDRLRLLKLNRLLPRQHSAGTDPGNLTLLFYPFHVRHGLGPGFVVGPPAPGDSLSIHNQWRPVRILRLFQRGKRVFRMAGWTGLEPATFCVTGRRSNQLSYHPVCL